MENLNTHSSISDVLVKTRKSRYGQYFTPSSVAKLMVNLSTKAGTCRILEPSCGEGVFIDELLKNGYNNIVAYEIDSTLLKKYDFIKYESFVSAKIEDNFDLIIGNPPFIRWKNLEWELKNELLENRMWLELFNPLCDYMYIFIAKSISLLNECGELIFICPEYWLTTTHAAELRNYILSNGKIDIIIQLGEAPLFKGATVSLIIFKFTKLKQGHNVLQFVRAKGLNSNNIYNKIIDLIKNESHTVAIKNKRDPWVLVNESSYLELNILERKCASNNYLSTGDLFNTSTPKVGDLFEIANGMVSGLDQAFSFPNNKCLGGTSTSFIKVLKAKNIKAFKHSDISSYIFLNNNNITELELKDQLPEIYLHLKKFEQRLQKRYNYNKEIPFWNWSFPRSYELLSKNSKKIFVPSKERISNKANFRFTLVDPEIYPTQDVTALILKDNIMIKESLEYLLAFLNSELVFNWVKAKGVIKGEIVEFSEKPLSIIPIRLINWKSEDEVRVHDKITSLVRQYLASQEPELIEIINQAIKTLF